MLSNNADGKVSTVRPVPDRNGVIQVATAVCRGECRRQLDRSQGKSRSGSVKAFVEPLPLL
jgi:hypothetical protein